MRLPREPVTYGKEKLAVGAMNQASENPFVKRELSANTDLFRQTYKVVVMAE